MWDPTSKTGRLSDPLSFFCARFPSWIALRYSAPLLRPNSMPKRTDVDEIQDSLISRILRRFPVYHLFPCLSQTSTHKPVATNDAAASQRRKREFGPWGRKRGNPAGVQFSAGGARAGAVARRDAHETSSDPCIPARPA